MSSTVRLLRYTARGARQATSLTARAPRSNCITSRTASITAVHHARAYTSSSPLRMPGLMPDTEHPEPPKSAEQVDQRTASSIEEEDYHKHADEFLNNLYERAEAVVEEREDVEVDYSAGVLTITMPPNGAYVINKQPPNRQIWLSSPISGPKRYDWSIEGESIHQKEGTGSGEWIYLRDGSSLVDVLRKELGIDATVGRHVEDDLAKKSTDPVE